MNIYVLKSTQDYNSFIEGKDYIEYKDCSVTNLTFSQISCSVSDGIFAIWNPHNYTINLEFTLELK